MSIKVGISLFMFGSAAIAGMIYLESLLGNLIGDRKFIWLIIAIVFTLSAKKVSESISTKLGMN